MRAMSEQVLASDELSRQAEQLRASGLLGKPGALSRLFDFLLERSLSGDVPKELEIAIHVFGKNPGFDVSQDAVVRVYVHKLRRRLEEFHSRSAPPRPQRISIPKGEYRLVLERGDVAAAVEGAEPVLPPLPVQQRRPRLLWLVPALLAVLAVGGALGAWIMGGGAAWDLRNVRHSAIWGPLLADDLPITIVVGDYYLMGERGLMGETDASSGVRRLVREFFINSHEDFQEHVQLNPELMRRYVDLDLTYLPAASAFALQDIVPVLGARKRVRVMLMSDLDANVLKSTHIVYVGYISGLGMLGDRAFAASRVTPGGSYDELVDQSTNTTYVSTATAMASGSSDFKDYGYFSTFAGPGGNRIVIVAGTRDTGVMHMAEALTRGSVVAEIASKAGQSASFESLYEVYGVARTNLNAKLLFVAGMKTEGIWDTR